MKIALTILFLWSSLAVYGQKMDSVATFDNQQVTGLAVAKDGRMFVTFPNWSDTHTLSVVEVFKNGTLVPYPNDEWNRKDDTIANRWICVQSAYADDSGGLWILDPASPKMEGVVPGGAKLVKIDLATNQVAMVIKFDEFTAPLKSYLNDVRVDTATGHAYITDSGLGALLVVNLQSGKIRRLLTDLPATKAEPDVELAVDGLKPTDPKTGRTPQIHADGIALDTKNGYLYFHALTGHTLYRIRTRALRDETLSEDLIADRVERIGPTPASDGMLTDQEGNVLLTAFEQNAIGIWNASDETYRTVLQDKRLQWPDSMAWGPDGLLYVTTSQIHRTPRFNQGRNDRVGPFAIWKINLTAKPETRVGAISE